VERKKQVASCLNPLAQPLFGVGGEVAVCKERDHQGFVVLWDCHASVLHDFLQRVSCCSAVRFLKVVCLSEKGVEEFREDSWTAELFARAEVREAFAGEMEEKMKGLFSV